MYDRLVRFGVFDFDPSALQLRRAQRPVRLRPQALKLLRIFISHPRQLIPRETIQQELWGADVHVDFEQGVNHVVKQLRAALGDDANAPRYIETLPRLGYRFIAPVDVVPAGEPSAGVASAATTPIWRGVSAACCWLRRAPWPLPACYSCSCPGLEIPRAALPANSTLAVLPFDVADAEGKPEYLGLSLADAVIARLATGGVIRVRPVAATRSYDQGSRDVRAVGRTLRADYVLAGVLRRREDAIGRSSICCTPQRGEPFGVARSMSTHPTSSVSKRRCRNASPPRFRPAAYPGAAAPRTRWRFRRTSRAGLTWRSSRPRTRSRPPRHSNGRLRWTVGIRWRMRASRKPARKCTSALPPKWTWTVAVAGRAACATGIGTGGYASGGT